MESKYTSSIESFTLGAPNLKGKNIIEASAGTGKTFSIANIYLRLVLEAKLSVDKILVVTFTVAATDELRSRIRKKLKYALDCLTGKIEYDDAEEEINSLIEFFGEENPETAALILRAAVNSFDEAAIYTIDSLCQQMIVDNAFESGSLRSIEINPEKRETLLSIIMDFWRDKLSEPLTEKPTAIEEFLADLIITYKVTPEILMELQNAKPLDPQLMIIPKRSGVTLESAFDTLKKAREDYDKIVKDWKEERERVYEILHTAPEINKKKYPFRSFDKNFKMMDDYCDLATDIDIFSLPQTDWFTQTKLESSLNSKASSCPENPFFSAWEKFLEEMKKHREVFHKFIIDFKYEFLDFVQRRNEESKSASNERSYNDVLQDAHGAVTGKGGETFIGVISERYHAALIDEFQDTNRLQYEIFQKIFADTGLPFFIIGDPKQAIYRFRGADIFSYIEAASLRALGEGDRKFSLDKNWRSRPEVIEAVNRIFSGAFNPFLQEDIIFSWVAPGNIPHLAFMENGENRSGLDIVFPKENSTTGDLKKELLEEHCLSFISEKITDLLAGECFLEGEDEERKRIEPGDIAILVRTRDHGEKIQERLRKFNIPSVIKSDKSIFQSPEASRVYLILRAVLNPASEKNIFSALGTNFFNLEADEIYKLRMGGDIELNGKMTTFDTVVDSFARYGTLWNERGIFPMMTALMREENFTGNIFRVGGGERELTNLKHLIEVLQSMEQGEKLSPLEVLNLFGKYIENPPAEKDRYELRLESDDKLVKIMTMHKSKGLEFPIVFSMFIPKKFEDEIESSVKSKSKAKSLSHDILKYHDIADSNRIVMDIAGNNANDIKARAQREEKADELRLIYVTLTRAKSKCYLVSGKNRAFVKSALGHLLFSSVLEEEKLKKVNFEAIDEALNDLAAGSNGTIRYYLHGDGENEKPRFKKEESSFNFGVKEFSGHIDHSWRTWSYSSLSAKGHSRERDDDEAVIEESPPEIIKKSRDIFDFPAGARAGQCIHEIFEMADFTVPRFGLDEGTLNISEILAKHGFETDWADIMETMLQDVTGAELPGGGRLGAIGERLNELQFYIPIPGGKIGSLQKIVAGDEACGEGMAFGLENDVTLRGLLTGFIDMVFIVDGKYYILDWKSNIIGGTAESFTEENILREMELHNYHLQYYIYTLALHRYLKLRLPDYDFKRHFGGVFYLFVRGVRKGKSRGIFYSMPRERVVLKMDEFFHIENGTDLTSSKAHGGVQ